MDLCLDDDINEGFGFASGGHNSLSDGVCVFRCAGSETLNKGGCTGTSGT